ncbi:hypothetical protein GHT06_010926 [Daphnia sinensis]|uniref:RING-type domain-containing protein n=1 Tax=Daphnia sinensis TaxID=1820382 RepID=A0AAD5LT20_9CRUS|nr:hypothetical protein GHT06_010926 [Daphnia sinensis]
MMNAIEDESESFITCPVCLLKFDDESNKPKRLACDHTICLQCLKEICRNGSVVCPCCRTNHRCEQGVEKLPTSQPALHIIKLIEKSRCPQLTLLSKTLEAESMVKELLAIYSPDGDAFFEQLGKIIRFTVHDSARPLDPVCKLQDILHGNTMAVSKLHQTIAAYAGEMTQQHVDYLISDVQARWFMSDNTQRPNLLDFLHKLAYEGRNEQLTAKIMDVVGGFVFCADTPDELMDSCIEKLKKILSDGWTCDLFSNWLFTCAQAIQAQQEQRLALAAMKLLRHLCYLFAVKQAASNNHNHNSSEFRDLVFLHYKNIYTFIDQEWKLFGHAIAGFVTYVMKCRSAGIDPIHSAAVRERLAFLGVFLKYGEMCMDEMAATSVWSCLTDGPISDFYQAICFEWFTKIVEIAFDVVKETIIYLGPRMLSHRADVSNDVLGSLLDRFRDEHLANRMQDEEESNLMDGLAEFLERQDISRSSNNMEEDDEYLTGISPVMPVPQRFDIANSIFVLTVMKKRRLLGRIQIKPSPRFASAKFVQELGTFCYAHPRKIGRRIAKSTKDTFISLKMKNAMFQPIVPDMLNYHIWLDSDNYAQKACQVGITGIEAGTGRNESRVKGWQFVFFLHDMVPGASKSKKSLLFGDVVQGIDVVKSLSCSNLLTSHFSDGLRLILESVN